MRFIYIDEAGTSAKEPTTVVVGVLIEADTQLTVAEKVVSEIIKDVPAQFKDSNGNFIFHAKDIWGNHRYRNAWSFGDRLEILKKMMSIPRNLGLPISMARIRRNAPYENDGEPLGLTKEQFQLFNAFAGCVASADRYMQKNARENEIGYVVAEDISELRSTLKLAPNIFRRNPIRLSSDMLLPTTKESEQGFIEQDGELKVLRIRPIPHFVSKKDDPLLQIADACAFAFRRYFAEQSYGEEFIKFTLGGTLNRHDYRGPSSYCNFYKKVS